VRELQKSTIRETPGNWCQPVVVQPSRHPLISRIDQIQEYLGCRLLIENPARDIKFTNHSLDEAHFLKQIAERTGCGLLLDITNLYVSAFNLGFDPM